MRIQVSRKMSMWTKGIALSALSIACCASFTFAATKKVSTGEDWLKLNENKRLQAVTSFIKHAAERGVVIKKDPALYCEKMDDFYAQHPDMKEEGMGKLLKTVMIMEYDWEEKGVDKDALAKAWLGDELYKANLARLKSQKR
jgi:hypothetical protein